VPHWGRTFREAGLDPERVHGPEDLAVLPILTKDDVRRLGRELLGHGVSHSANRDRQRFAGNPVAVVGGGTAAVEDALLCAEAGSSVTLLHHSAHFRARHDFLERARKHRSIRIIANARVRRIVGKERVEAVEYQVRGSTAKKIAKVDAVFVRIGWRPRTELLDGKLRLDRQGYIRAGAGGATGVPGVYAAGDVCSPRWPSIANAAGQGAAAAWEIARYLGRLER
jgi:thioredoxin reductase (NADPH)